MAASIKNPIRPARGRALLLALAIPFGPVLVSCASGPVRPALAADNAGPAYLRDRGSGISTSLFGTYIRPGELLVYPFFEYVRDHNREYNPDEWGLALNRDFRGTYHASAEQLFIGYGLSDRLAFEIEAAYMSAHFEKSPGDPSTTPRTLDESGFGDIEGQARIRLMMEGERHPEIFGFVEVTAASQTNRLLIGDPDWDVKPGIGFVRGFSWGTMTLRGAGEYLREESHLIVGEVGLEYLKRLSPDWRVFLAIEGGEGGGPDEWELIPSAQWRLSSLVSLKLDSSVAITSKATDWTPQMGLLFSFAR